MTGHGCRVLRVKVTAVVVMVAQGKEVQKKGKFIGPVGKREDKSR